MKQHTPHRNAKTSIYRLLRNTTFIIMICSVFSTEAFAKKRELKPRLVVCTDIGSPDVEPDDMESAVRLLAYADLIEIEAIITTVGWNCDPYPPKWAEYLTQVIDGYEKDIPNLMKRSGQKKFNSLSKEHKTQEIGYWPSASYIRSRAMMGSERAGIKVIGGNNNSAGSDFLIRLADEPDERPIWVAAWGSANTLAQAIWKVKQTRTPEEVRAFVRKFRVYTITDQDMDYGKRTDLSYSSHMWLREEFEEDLMFIWDEGTWQLQCDLGKSNWELHERNIQNKGAMGSAYPKYKWGVEGDTPSFLYILPNGLSNPEDPTQVNWGGVHAFGISPDKKTKAWTSWENPTREMTCKYKTAFYKDELNDFMARMQWIHEGKGNTNPNIIINGIGGRSVIELKAKAGRQLLIDASMSHDKENNKLTFKWWQQTDAGSYNKSINLTDGNVSSLKIDIPNDASNKEIHIICEVHDNGDFDLVSYRRIIIDVE